MKEVLASVGSIIAPRAPCRLDLFFVSGVSNAPLQSSCSRAPTCTDQTSGMRSYYAPSSHPSLTHSTLDTNFLGSHYFTFGVVFFQISQTTTPLFLEYPARIQCG